MSADRWDHCPVCKKEYEKKIEDNKNKNHKKLQDQYGKGTIEDFERFKQNLIKQEKTFEEGLKFEETLREDYALGVCSDEVAYLNYHAECQKCGAIWTFEKKGIQKEGESDES